MAGSRRRRPAAPARRFTVARPGPLPASRRCHPSFDDDTAASLATELARDHPGRVPGTSGADGAARWVTDKLALYGLDVETRRWPAERPGPRRNVRLTNIAAVVPGGDARDDRLPSPIATRLAAARERTTTPRGRRRWSSWRGRTPPAGPTVGPRAAAAHARLPVDRRRRLRRRRRRPLRRALALPRPDARGRRARRLGRAPTATSGAGGRRPSLAGPGARADARPSELRSRPAAAPSQPSVLRQLVDLALPFGYGEQSAFLGAGISALRLTTADDSGAAEATRRRSRARSDRARFAQLGRAAQSVLDSLDGGVELAQGTSAHIVLGNDRFVRGWALALTFLVATCPSPSA